MVTITLFIIASLVLVGFIKIQINFQKSTLEHASNVKKLENALSETLKVSKNLYEKVTILECFSQNYKTNIKKISTEIVALQQELFEIISEK